MWEIICLKFVQFFQQNSITAILIIKSYEIMLVLLDISCSPYLKKALDSLPWCHDCCSENP